VFAVTLPVFFKVTVRGTKELWKFSMKIFGIPVKLSSAGKRKSVNKYNKSKLKKRRIRISPKKIIVMMKKTLHSFHIRYLQANIDTGDYPLNARLIPVAALINGGNIMIKINFEDRNSVDLKIITRLYKLLWILLRYIIF
jgi:hypothetical protein